MRWKPRKDAVPSVSIRMAMAVVGVLPIVLFIQSNFVKEITLGGVKG